MGTLKKKRKGFLLLQMALAMIVIGLLSVSLFTICSGQFSMIQASRTALQAQQYAEVDTNVLQLVDYDDIDDYVHVRQAIDVSKIITADGWEDEISVTPETVVDVAQNTRQRIATVKIYKIGDTLARYSVEVPLSTKGRGGYPVGSVIVWPLASAPLGVDADNWLECNGQTVNSSKYPKLAKLMSSVPDYRGYFLRGEGGNADGLGIPQGDTSRRLDGTIGQQAGGMTITGGDGGYLHPSGYSTTGAQPFWISQHLAGISLAIQGYMGSNFSSSSSYTSGWNDLLTKYKYQLVGDKDAGYALQEIVQPISIGYNSEMMQIDFDVSRVWPVSNEFRPVNKAVHYLIKGR